ncbi:MAG: 3-oxoacyl-[acyl-carrier-protein] reductase [Peptococcaceae bacterium]|nr:3-oxoacyl-[acyl-carrier-protein] reductase [Peptococcaceae bacterium]
MLSGQTAVITGASRGIGKAITLTYAQNGANVALVYARNAEAAEDVRQQAEAFGVKAMAYQCNVADYQESKKVCDQIVADMDSVSILVNNAGIAKDYMLLKMSEEAFDEVIDVNLKGTFNFIKHLSPTLMKSSAGKIINLSSVSGLMGTPYQTNYSAAKAGVIAMSKTVAKELSSKNITCNVIAPGFIKTDMTSSLSLVANGYIEFAVPFRRMGTPEEVASVALFLASEMASYITGEVIRVDGGLSM